MIEPLPVDFHPAALEESIAAACWYEDRSTAAAEAFRSEVERAIDKIGEAPWRWPGYSESTRRFMLRRFPFSVVYRVRTGSVLVVAVAHARRRPGYWRGR